MKEIRRSRIAINRGEFRADVHGVAAPIFDRIGNAVAAIGVSGPAHRFGADRLNFFSPEVKRSAELIAAKLFGQSRNTWHCRRFAAEAHARYRSEEHTYALQSLMLISYAAFCMN